MKDNFCIICLGSNTDAVQNLKKARSLLDEQIKQILWASEIWTAPIAIGNSSFFINQVACLHTTLSNMELSHICKHIECEIGRNKQDKALGIVRIDIDILMYDHRVLKPDDWQREYVKEGIKQLKI